MRLSFAFAAAVLAALGLSVHAETITFSQALIGFNNLTYTEGSFTVSTLSGTTLFDGYGIRSQMSKAGLLRAVVASSASLLQTAVSSRSAVLSMD